MDQAVSLDHATSRATEGGQPPAGCATAAPPSARPGPDQVLHAAQARLTAGISPIGPALAALDWAAHLANAPERWADLQRMAARQAIRFATLALDPRSEPVIEPRQGDRRFTAPAWQGWPFKLMSQGFLLAEEWVAAAVQPLPGVSAGNARMVAHAVRQTMDMLAPSNLPWCNPEVLEATARSGGRNLAQGLLHAWEDMAAAGAAPSPRMVPGRELACTPGKVIFRNELIELMQYTPTTPGVRPEPILIVPAWIMKYYILDLSPENSLIRYMVGQGFTVFAISWRNPDRAMAQTGLDEYRRLGVMAALDAVGQVAGRARVHACGYCLGGTLLSIAAATMSRDGDTRLASITLLAAQTDFTEAGDLQLFITEDQLAFLSDVMAARGYLDSREMAGAFQALRANDLVWSRALRRYALGEAEYPTDLMAWNADGTRMPARMHSEYLRRLFLDNDLAEGRFYAGGAPVAVEDIDVPAFVVGTETDHIAPWRSVYKIHLLHEGEIDFVLTSGGHNAGIVSEPGHRGRHFRRAHRRPGGHYLSPEDWMRQADRVEGSWWPAWAQWLAEKSGEAGPPPTMGATLCDAPGTYVLEH